MSAKDPKDPNLTPAEIRLADELIQRALRPRAVGFYSSEERLVLAILTANYSRLQRARGKKSKGIAKEKAEYRKKHVNILLRYVVEKRYRRRSHFARMLDQPVEWLTDSCIEASESQVRRDIHAALELGPLPTW